MPDRILLHDLAFFGHHGVRPEEKSLGQRFYVDLELELDLAPAGRADDLRLSVDYGEAYLLVRDVVEGPALNTLEAVAERIAALLLERFETLSEATVRVKKPAAPIKDAHFGLVAVEVRRQRTLAHGG